jgi:mRNA interferase MazF
MRSTTSYRSGELVLVAFPFTGGTRAKPRPALVILDSGDADVVVARVTTQPYGTAFDVTILDWRAAGLLAPSVVRLHKLASLAKSLIGRSLGQVSASDRQRIATVLQGTFGTWT